MSTIVSFFIFNLTSPYCSLSLCCRSHGGHPSIRAPGSPLVPDAVQRLSPDRLQASGTQRGRHGPADHAAAAGDPEPPGSAPIAPLPRGEPLHPVLLPARRAGRSQDPGGVRGVCVSVRYWTSLEVWGLLNTTVAHICEKYDTLQHWSQMCECL